MRDVLQRILRLIWKQWPLQWEDVILEDSAGEVFKGENEKAHIQYF